MRITKKQKRDIAFKSLFTGVFVGILFGVAWNVAEAKETHIDPTEVSKDGIIQNIKANIPVYTREQLSVAEDINKVFGEYAPKAFLLLQGNGKPGACAENRKLDPNALNDNTQWGGVGRDWGVFQINDQWQGVKNIKFLKDPAINIRMAWRLFEDNGYSFKLWTCGKVYGI